MDRGTTVHAVLSAESKAEKSSSAKKGMCVMVGMMSHEESRYKIKRYLEILHQAGLNLVCAIVQARGSPF